MSEEINLEASICTTEDAFEQFQATSMYEEEEFITLSDIVSPEPEPAAPLLPSDISDGVPYDNEVVLPSNCDEQDFTNEPGISNSDAVSISQNTLDNKLLLEQIPSQTDQELITRPKRGRKKKILENFVTDYPENSGPALDNNVQENPTSSTKTTSRSRRGRKPKQNVLAQNDTTLTGVNTDSLTDLINSSNTPRKGRKRLSENMQVVQLESQSTTKQTPGKRGRPKNNLTVQTPLETNEQLNDSKNIVSGESTHENSVDETVINNTSNDLEVNEEQKQIEDLEQQSEIGTKSEENVSSEITNSCTKKISTKRGRRKKKPQEEDSIESEQPFTKQRKVSEEEIATTLKQLGEGSHSADETQCDDLQQPSIEKGLKHEFDDDEDDGDDISLSKLKETLDTTVNNLSVEMDMELEENMHPESNPIQETAQEAIQTSEFKIIPNSTEITSAEDSNKVAEIPLSHENGDNDITNANPEESLLVEDLSRRPVRRRAKKILHYDEGSDEDPFANVELSDDEPRGKKTRKYDDDDDEYVPTEHKKGPHKIISSSSDSDISLAEDNLDGIIPKKKFRKNMTPKKRNSSFVSTSQDIKKEDNFITGSTVPPAIDLDHDDIEVCLEPSVIPTNDDKKSGLEFTSEFENFIANKIQGTNIKIKKVSSNQNSQRAPLEIPVLDPEAKKTVEISSQTDITKTTSVGSQTSTPYEVSMKKNVSLTAEQSDQACIFLKSIVKTTSELGQLMTEKSEDFITKKINTSNVTDTFKMDYCVKKSFLLLKLAKHNILQMETDLSKQYEEFLKRTKLIEHREEPKVIAPTETDSDCEIVEEPVKAKPEKPKFNPKTVFLNKELSIKIAKKPTVKSEPKCKSNLNIKDTHTVWISDSVMVKKVKPTQSFLAQDSRNKKPPDCYVTVKMVNDFFKNYYRKLAPTICAPFTSAEWLGQHKIYTCCYFYAKPSPSTEFPVTEEIYVANNANTSIAAIDNEPKYMENSIPHRTPESLLALCTYFLQKQLKMLTPNDEEKRHQISETKMNQKPRSLFRLCLNTLGNQFKFEPQNNNLTLKSKCEQQQAIEVPSLKVLCYKKMKDIIFLQSYKREPTPTLENEICILSIFNSNHISENIENHDTEPQNESVVPQNALSLKQLCHKKIMEYFLPQKTDNVSNIDYLDENSILSDSNILDCSSTTDNDNFVMECDSRATMNPLPLKSLCYRKVLELMPFQRKTDTLSSLEFLNEDSLLDSSSNGTSDNLENEDLMAALDFYTKYEPKSLFSLCVKWIKMQQKVLIEADTERHLYPEESVILSSFSLDNTLLKPKSLKEITFNNIKSIIFEESLCNLDKGIKIDDVQKVNKVKTLSNICYEMIMALTAEKSENVDRTDVALTINSVNTMSEEAFHNMDENSVQDDESNFYEEDNYEDDFNNFEEDAQQDDNNWVAQLQMKELRSCSLPNDTTESANINEINNVQEEPIQSRIKLEPIDELEQLVDSRIVKSEPIQNFDEMTVIPDSIVTKQEHIESAGDAKGIVRQNSSSFDVNSFENFVSHNKIMHPLDEPDDIFSQSGQRIRRQHEPDYNNEYDPALSLLIPQTFEPMSIETAKGRLMASSSDEETVNKKTQGKKKIDKKTKPKKVKKNETKQLNKEMPTAKEKIQSATVPALISEVAVLTRRMREKIRQEEKKIESSDSGEENVPIAIRKEKEKERKETERTKEKERKEIEKTKEKERKETEKTKENEKVKSSKNNKSKPDVEIQCNNVDSTEQLDSPNDSSENIKKFPGFSAVDQNEISSYEKYVKYVYNKILPKVSADAGEVPPELPECSTKAPELEMERPETPLIDYEDPVEMLECEPTMPIFDDTEQDVPIKKTLKNKKSKTDEKKKEIEEKSKTDEKQKEIEEKKVVDEKPAIKDDEPAYCERQGWKCYKIDPYETKLYQNAAIILEKLPESFVETYFMYQSIADRDKEDEEVDRLTNLNSLNRYPAKEGKRPKGKSKSSIEGQHDKNATDMSRPTTPNSDGYAELTASEDEGANVDDEIPPPAPRQSNENSLAKNSLMNDSDPEDAETQLKKEANDGSEQHSQHTKSKSKHKLKLKEEPKPDSESLMLTADKMMNKELNLLHAPVVLDDENTTPEKGNKIHSPRSKHKRGTRGNSSREHFKNDEDSSSEEEKQWVTTKEKLLKRMVKKYDTTGADDAKRAKLVSEFIQRRGGDMEVRRKRGKGRSGRLSARKKLEREKQMRVLSHELLGTPMDDNMAGPRGAHTQSYFKGRRNIRKVIDKKSLQRSTVIANMEEFERKKRLVQRQARLREELGVEEGVSVLVINGEVCLEYSFEEQCPLVSVHPFFTKVMKAHQYEGVKFMWDACFETLEKLESGHPGGGCILAHCMGLGKTLQVLALLHTVLTHPRVGMQRVLVCCPLSTVLNWVDEIHKWIGPVTDQIKVFELSKLKKTYERAYQLEDWYNGGGIFIIGYELFRSLTTICPELDDVRPTIVNKIRSALLDPGPDIIICDEGHLLKNDASVLAVAMSRVVTKRRIVLTGTPMQNNLREYYCMVNFVKPNLLGTYSEYSNRFENPIMNGQHRDSQVEDIKLMKQRTHILHKVLEGCLQRQEASVLYPYLPKKHEYTVFISLTKVQWDLYKHYIENYSTKHKKNHGILKDFHTLQKIWSHPQVLHNFQMKARDDSDKSKIKPERLEDDLAHEDLAATEDIKPLDTDTWWLEYLDGGNMLDSLDTSNKFVVVFRILDECIALGDKVLIFSTSLITLDALEYFLKKINKWSLGQEYYRLDGSVPAEVRQKWCREFNAEHNHKTKLFLISTRAGCLGLNMVAANRVIIFDTSWNPAHDIQSIFRVYRFGQKKDCYIYRLVALGTMEQKIYERSVTKQAVSCRVVDEQQIDRHYNMAELTELYRYDEWGSSVAGGVAVGVCDVALLRVARLPALHAVHEHDSLLRGSTEQGLNEHERDAAWMQFQQEHAHKQMQNQLTSSFSMHISLPSLESAPPAATQPSTAGSSSVPTQPEIKTENTGQDNENNVALKTYTSKRGRPRKRIPSPPPVNSPEMEEEMVSKVMNLLIKHNFTTQSPTEIAKLVAKVRKMVADGTVPQGLDNESILAKSIANVLLMKDPKLEPLVEEAEVKGLKKRGRKRKSDKPPEPEPEPVPEIQLPENTGRRRAALMAERQMASSDSIIDLDRDDDWQNDDWQPDPEDIQPNEPEVPVTERQPEISTLPVKQAISNISANASIVLSDDDEPTQKKVKVKAEKVKGKGGKAVVKSEPDSNVVPLHVSLLSNKNFIKIVAHTYLEGNPMLDEDAATLAAQYSTHKAKKEIESTGKMITSGPIYDIAIKVLGIDILKKLNKANPNLKPSVLPTEESSTQDVIVEQKPKPPAVQTKPKPAAVQTKPGPRLKAKGIAQLTNPPPVLGSSPEPKGISVVPVGLFNSAGGIAPSAPYSPEVREESILPDDDDVIVDDHPRPTFKRNAKPLVLNSVLAASAAKTHPTPTSISIPHPSRPPIPKLVISAGKLMPQSSYIATPQPSTAPIVTQPAPTLQQNTICLDSDEEETITPNIAPPKPSKRVALKSTAKPPVPVSITAANPHAYAGHVPPPGLQMPNPVNKPINLNIPGKNFVVIPASQIGKMTQLPPGVTPAMFNLAKASASQGMPMFQNVSSLPQNIVMAPQNIVMAPQSTIQSNIAPPRIVQSAPSESILPTQVANAPKSSTKTVCKPGDILRVTSSGQIEILNRSEEAAPVLTTDTSLAKGRPRRNTQAAPTPVQPKMAPTSEEAAPVLTTETSLAKGRPRRNIQAAPTPVQPKTAPTPPAAPANPPPAPSKPEPPAPPSPESSRVRKISSSSSSSDSRPSSPEDPLSILKDVVHIQAADYVTEPRKEKPKETTLVGSTSITRSSSSTPSKNEKTPLTTPTKPTSKAPTPAKMPTKSQDEIIKHISKTDTILKKLDNILAPSSISKSRSSIQKPAPKKPTTSVTSTSFVDVINLDDDLPSEPKSSTKSNHTRTSSTKTQAKVSAQSKTTALPKKVEGTSKNIILTMSGKTPTVSTTNASSSKGRVSNDKVLPTTSKSAPTKSTDPKKRQPPPPAASAPKKKKTEPMTLKDFNLDDIDDIIELD